MRISDWSSDVCSSDLVRLSGQDARRGTFFHRHATIHDFKNGARFTPLRHLVKDKYGFVVNDTLLSEEGVLGFEYGYSTTDPDSLVIWERSEEHTSELQSLMRISYAVFCLHIKNKTI